MCGPIYIYIYILESSRALRARSILWYHTTLGIDPGRNTQDHAGKLRQGYAQLHLEWLDVYQKYARASRP